MNLSHVSEAIERIKDRSVADLCAEDREFVMTVAAYCDSGEVVRLSDAQLERLDYLNCRGVSRDDGPREAF
jgi:hypothetical protein